MKKGLVVVLAALSVAAGAAMVGAQWVSGAGESEESVFISITPCRLVDTRAGEENVGPVSSPVGSNATVLFNAHDGLDGDSPCEIPPTATAISANVVAIAPSASGFLTLFPSDVRNPGTATLNFVGGQAPTPNAAVVPLASSGTFNVFNAFGTVNVVIDVSGFYQPSSAIGSTGPTGPEGPTGPQGPAGQDGPEAIPGYEVVEGPITTVAGTFVFIAEAECPPGKVALGGGGAKLGDEGALDQSDWEIRESRPKLDGSGWQIELRPTNTVAEGAGRAYAVCASGPTATTTP